MAKWSEEEVLPLTQPSTRRADAALRNQVSELRSALRAISDYISDPAQPVTLNAARMDLNWVKHRAKKALEEKS